MTSPTTSHIEHLAPTYKILVLIFHSNLTQTRGFIGRFYYDLLMRFGRCLLFWTTLYFCVLCYFRPPPPQQYGHSCHSRRQKVSAMMFTTFYSGDWSVRHKTIAIAASPHTHTHTHTMVEPTQQIIALQVAAFFFVSSCSEILPLFDIRACGKQAKLVLY